MQVVGWRWVEKFEIRRLKNSSDNGCDSADPFAAFAAVPDWRIEIGRMPFV